MGLWSWTKRNLIKPFWKTTMYPLKKGLQGAEYIFDRATGRDVAKEQMDLTERINAENLENQNRVNEENIKLQKEFAKHGISWKVADAQSAGIHPLAALGADTVGFSPSSRAFDQEVPKAVGSGFGNGLQLLSTIIGFKRDIEALRGLRLNNDLTAIERNDRLKNVSVEFGSTALNPRKITSKLKKGTGGIEAGVGSLENYDEDSNGYLWLKMTQDNSEILENSWYDQFKYIGYRSAKVGKAVIYYYFPNSKKAEEHRKHIAKLRPPKPKGYHYRFNPFKGFKLYPDSMGLRLYEDQGKMPLHGAFKIPSYSY